MKLESLLASNAANNAFPANLTAPAPTTFPLAQQTIPLQITRQSQLSSQLMDMPRPTFEIALNFTCSLGSFPGASITDTKTILTELPDKGKPDVITRSILPLDTGEGLFQYYQGSLDRYVYRMLPNGDTLSDVRSRSSLLTSAICTVAAFCQGSPSYENCLNDFKAEVSSKTFAKDHTFDDIRALCIGAFWLSDISYTLCSLAVRLAAEVNLHRCISKMPHTDPKCYARTRLYFLVFLCDQHCSLRHGRPPMTRTLRSLKSPRTLLRSDHAVPLDAQMIAEVELWTLAAQVFDSFGADVGTSFDQSRLVELNNFGDSFDKWHQEWTQLLSLRMELDDLTQGLWALHYHAAKLCLYSHVLRGTSTTSGPVIFEDPTKQGIANIVGLAADHALRFFKQFNTWISHQALPSYFSTMAAFASLFLLRIIPYSPSQALTPIQSKQEILPTLRILSQMLHRQFDTRSMPHPLQAVANGIDVVVGGRSTTISDTTSKKHAVIAPKPVEASTSTSSSVPGPGIELFDNELLGQPFADDMSWMIFPFANDLIMSCPDSDVL